MQILKRNEKYIKATTYKSKNNYSELTLKEMHMRFIKFKKSEGMSPRTIDDYEKAHGYFMDYLGMDLSANQLTAEVFLDYKAYMINKKYSPNTINIRLRNMRTFLRFCYKNRLIKHPFHEELDLVKAPIDNVEGLTEDEIELLLNVFDDSWFTQFRDKLITIMLLDTMCRIGELTKVKRSEVYLEEGYIYLQADNTKARKGRRVPLSEVTIGLLSVYMQETEAFNSEYLFVTYHGKKLNEATYRKSLLEYGRKAGIKDNVHPHKLRHTGALTYTVNGGDPFSLQKILGHKDLSMTRRYIQMNDKHIIEQHNKFSVFNNKE